MCRQPSPPTGSLGIGDLQSTLYLSDTLKWSGAPWILSPADEAEFKLLKNSRKFYVRLPKSRKKPRDKHKPEHVYDAHDYVAQRNDFFDSSYSTFAAESDKELAETTFGKKKYPLRRMLEFDHQGF